MSATLIGLAALLEAVLVVCLAIAVKTNRRRIAAVGGRVDRIETAPRKPDVKSQQFL